MQNPFFVERKPREEHQCSLISYSSFFGIWLNL